MSPLLWLIYLLIRIPNARCLVADDGLVSMVRCKHGFQWRRSNFYEKFVSFQTLLSKINLLRNFRIKVSDCGDWINFWKSWKKLTRRQDEVGALKRYRMSLVFLFCNIHTQTTKEICRLVAHFLSCNITKHY